MKFRLIVDKILEDKILCVENNFVKVGKNRKWKNVVEEIIRLVGAERSGGTVVGSFRLKQLHKIKK